MNNRVNIEKNFGDVNIGKIGVTNKSYLGEVINAFAKISSADNYEENVVELPFQIDDKISHNDVIQYAYLFEEYISKEKSLREVYTSIHEASPFARNFILKSIRREYQKWKGYLILEEKTESETELELIRRKSDFIIGKVIEDSKKKLVGIDSVSSVEEEILSECIDLIISDAFVECKILENPSKIK